MQLNRYLAICGVTSRRKANEAIVQGRVSVNHQKISDLGRSVDPKKDCVHFDGQRLVYPQAYSYILLNKPQGVITTVRDDRGRKTVLDLIDGQERIFPVGRLDLDTVGVLLLTNDGDLTYRLTHPRYQIEKVYRAWVEGSIGNHEIGQLKRGVDIEPGVRVCGEMKVLGSESHRTWVEILVNEGKKRQIKRMMAAVGTPVVQLERIQFAGLMAGELRQGEWRHLTETEVNQLYEKTGLSRRPA
jgi:23S rRNA pseudouridine2605 synthase